MKVSHSSVDGYMKCPQFYKLYKLDGVQLRSRPVYFVTGSAFHEFKQHMFEGVAFEGCMRALNKVFEEVDLSLRDPDEISKFHTEWARALGMAEGYYKKYKNEVSTYTSVVCENHITMKLKNGVEYEGHLDMLVKDADGDWWVHETKTAIAAGINDAYWHKIRIDRQVLGYLWLAKEKLGVWPKGIVYDVVIKTTHRRKAKESVEALARRLASLYTDDDSLFCRQQLVLSTSAIKQWYLDTLTVTNKMEYDLELKEYPKNTGSCNSKFGHCYFLDICASGGVVNKIMYTTREEREN